MPIVWTPARFWWWEARRWLRPYSLIGDVRVAIDSSMPLDFRNALYHGNYERDEMSALRMTLEPHDVVMELGTGLGFLSSYAARIVGSNRVATYEANPGLEPIIRRTFALNHVSPSLTIGMLGAQHGQAEFFVNALFYESSTRAHGSAKRVAVPVRPVSDEMQRVKPTYLIMDVEGSEQDLIPLMDLSAVRKCLIELHPDVIGPAATKKLIEQIAAAGLELVPQYSRGQQYFFRRVGTETNLSSRDHLHSTG